MTPDLLSACVFCAAQLLQTDLPTLPGLAGEFGASYATLARWDDSKTVFRHDASDVTPKFLLVGLGSVRFPSPGLGAGTPAFEWSARLAIGNSHDEADQTFRVPDAVVATGSGRYENFDARLRLPLGERDSVEAAIVQRVHKITDLVNLGGSNFQFDEERDLFAQTVESALGLRHRFVNMELAAYWRTIRPEGKYNSALSLRRGRATLQGAQVEGKWRLPRTWTLGLSAQTASANMPVAEERLPDFAHVRYHSPARIQAASLSIAKSWGATDLFFSAGLDRSQLPFVVMAVLGEETRYFDQGYRPVSETREVVWNLEARRRIAPGVHVRAYARVMQGNETVSLTDPAGALAPVTLSVRRGGRWPITQFMLGGGADFTVGTASRSAP